MNYYKICCHIEEKDLELLSSYFFDNQCLGIEIIDKNEKEEDFLGEIYSIKGDYPEIGLILIGYFENIPLIEDFISKNKINLLSNLICKKEVNVDYEKQYRSFFNEIKLNDKISIIPSWENISLDDKIYIKIEPGFGFGTGHHTSTQLAMSNFLTYYNNEDSLLDFGTGSGILAILAKKCGLKTVYGIDLDPLALKNARHNALINDVQIIFSDIEIYNFKHTVSIIIANIVYKIIIENLYYIYNHIINGGILILSGILINQKEDMIIELKTHNFHVLNITQKDEWISIVARKEVL